MKDRIKGTYAKNNILMAIANPACSAMTAMRRPLDGLMPVALRTGYLCHSEKGRWIHHVSLYLS